MTKYVVLRQDGDGWFEHSYAEAQTAKAAIRKAVQDSPGVYVAIPARSFRPVSAEVDTKTSVKFSTV